ncbi:hypothetical protein [Actinoplanes sp. URMC 104]|uniref:tetratricopeptide repeat protein n=1 Tax=Actinoplanes sp. URMC 104 TaxID=3423409 RepID=UPI003F194FA0
MIFADARRQAQRLAEAGDAEAARALLDDVVSQGRPRLADGDPELLETMRQLAGLHRAAGNPIAARRLLEEAEAAGQRPGDPDPLAVMLAYDLAVVAEELANRHVARSAFARVAESGPAALGEQHWAVAHARAYLGGGPPPAPAPEPGATVAPPAPTAEPAAAVPPLAAPEPAGVPPLAAPQPTGGVQRFAASRPSRARRAWLPAAIGGVAVGAVVAAVVAVLVLRPADDTRPAASVQLGPSSAPVAVAPSAVPRTSAAPSATVPATATSAAAKPPATRPRTTPPAPRKTTPPPAARTRIVAPADNSRVPYPFDARFTVAPADVTAKDTVVALLICVAGRCYLDGKLDIIEGVAAPYTVYLGSTRPEGTGVAWKLRLDRLPASEYAKLIAARDAAIADGSWGDKGTPMSALNPAPVSIVTVVKS